MSGGYIGTNLDGYRWGVDETCFMESVESSLSLSLSLSLSQHYCFTRQFLNAKGKLLLSFSCSN
jgi:hypothetical protein